ncbi:MAG TPA: type II secretion system F family protein [Jatrophihabitantaceae bacterium]|jgi:tight adherence protein B
MIAAASALAPHSSGMQLWVVCAIAFVAMLAVALYVLLAPMAKRQRVDKQARLDEVHRYRVLGAYGGVGLEELEPGTPAESALTTKALAMVDKAVRARGQHNRIVFELERAGMRMRPEEWAGLQLAITVGLAAVVAFLVGPFGVPIGGLVGWAACRFYIRRRTRKRLEAFQTQLPDALQMLAGALRTGFALNQALGTVVREGIEPVSSEFGRALHEVRLGANLEDALDDVVDRMKSYDMGLVVMAIRTAREVGGNLAEVLQTTVHTMRERVELHGQVRVLSAEGRFSAKVLVALPILMAVYLLLFKKAYLKPLYTTGTGVALLVGGVLLLIAGVFWLSRLTKIEV